MEKILLNNKWNLRILSDGEIKGEFLKPFPKEGIEAEVPGSVYGTLLKEGYIADPYYRDNEIRILPIMENDSPAVTGYFPRHIEKTASANSRITSPASTAANFAFLLL